MKSETLIAYPKTQHQIKALKAFMQALGISFEETQPISKPYNPDFVEKLKLSKEQISNGRFVKVKVENLDKFLGL